MKVDVYKTKCSRTEKHAFLVVPTGLNVAELTEPRIMGLGELTFSKTVDLDDGQPVKNLDPRAVRADIDEFGWHLAE